MPTQLEQAQTTAQNVMHCVLQCRSRSRCGRYQIQKHIIECFLFFFFADQTSPEIKEKFENYCDYYILNIRCV